MPTIGIVILILLFINSLLNGKNLVKLSEIEFSKSVQSEEAKASKYTLKEIDANTGLTKWKLTAKEGRTQNNLKSAIIKDINAEIYKGKKVAFNLHAPFGKANTVKHEISLLGNVKARNKNGSFLLDSNRLEIEENASLKAKKGFNLVLKGKGEIRGKSALINHDQSEIKVVDLKEADLEKILLSGKDVLIERDKKGVVTAATISNGGKVLLKELNNDYLTAGQIKWTKEGNITAKSNVTYTSSDRKLIADELIVDSKGKITANNNVRIIHGETTCSGNKLTYENKNQIVISGSPKAYQDGKQITAEKILYNTTSGKVEAVGNVQISSDDQA